MAKPTTLYHNPRCGKSRQALALLREHGIEPEIVEYLKQPLGQADVERLIGQLNLPAHDLLRCNEPPYKELGLSPQSTPAEIARAIANYPILMQRPIAVREKRAVIGRPPERVLELP